VHFTSAGPDFRRPRKIIFTPYRRLDFTPPPPPPTPEEIEARQLAAELLECPVDESMMQYLQQYGVDVRPHRPGALLRRLRELKKRGRWFEDVGQLAWEMERHLYWI
jgi:hypothetical protein